MVEFAGRTAVAKSPLRGQSSGLSVSVEADDVHSLATLSSPAGACKSVTRLCAQDQLIVPAISGRSAHRGVAEKPARIW